MVAALTVNQISFETGGSSPSPPTVLEKSWRPKVRWCSIPVPVKVRVVDLMLGESLSQYGCRNSVKPSIALVAQMVEQGTEDPRVGCSIHSRCTRTIRKGAATGLVKQKPFHA